MVSINNLISHYIDELNQNKAQGFDLISAEFISGIITEKGLIPGSQL
jgi:translation initiation factor 2B subunit (eIF-2B alpha/beta/delta family)